MSGLDASKVTDVGSNDQNEALRRILWHHHCRHPGLNHSSKSHQPLGAQGLVLCAQPGVSIGSAPLQPNPNVPLVHKPQCV